MVNYRFKECSYPDESPCYTLSELIDNDPFYREYFKGLPSPAVEVVLTRGIMFLQEESSEFEDGIRAAGGDILTDAVKSSEIDIWVFYIGDVRVWAKADCQENSYGERIVVLTILLPEEY